MVKISFDDQEISVPESWADIRLADYERWMMSEPKNKTEQIKLVADICGLDVSIFLNQPTQLFDVVTEMVSFVFKEFDGEVKNQIKVDGVEYRISFTDELTLAEWVDVEAIFEQEQDERLSEILAILCRPVGEAYDSRLLEQRRAMFRQLPMNEVLPLVAFFLLQKKRSQHVLNLYSEVREEVAQYLRLTQSFVESGDGIRSLPIWQRIRYYFLMKSLKKQLSKFSDFSSISSIKGMPTMSKVVL